MKKVLTTVMILFAVGASSLAPVLANTCLRSSDIQNTVSPDGKVLMFHMKDGAVWRNMLQGSCPGLEFGGSFAWTLNGIDNICENQQTLRVLHSGEICTLGKFAKVTPAKMH